MATKEEELQAALTALSKLTPGKVHVSVGKGSNSPFNKLEDIELHKVSGPHPAGLVGTQINKLDPINKGEVVWTITPQDLVIIGELLLTGRFNAQRTVALAGSAVKSPKYFTTKILGSHKANQEAYIKALSTLNKVQIIYGLFKYKKIKCLVKNCTYRGSRVFDVPEEKRTDVNIAINMIKDAVNDKCDRLIVVSGDSDLVPAVKAVKLSAQTKK